MKSRDLQPRLLYPAKLSLQIKGQIKSFPVKKKLKDFITTKPVLYEMLKGLLEEEEEEEEEEIKDMNNKMAISIHLSTIESEKQKEQAEQKQTHSYREYFNGCQMDKSWGDG